jgi:hypothetical protein
MTRIKRRKLQLVPRFTIEGTRPLSRTPINRTFFSGAMRLRHSRAARAIARYALLGRASVACRLR